MTIMPLQEATSEEIFGGKAVQLGACLRAGLPVPEGLSISAGLAETLASEPARARQELASVARLVEGGVAVRSSAVGEDGRDASFAGQHLSLLNIRTVGELVDAIARVVRSGRSEGAIAYRQRLGLDGSPRIGVVVQRMVDPDCAGVLFTRNPTTGADERVVEAAFGLGEAVVQGLVIPDRHRISREGRILEQSIGHKDLLIRAEAAGGTIEVGVEESRANAACLNDRQLALLLSLARECEHAFPGGGHDIEWAFEGEELFLLQRRPITWRRDG